MLLLTRSCCLITIVMKSSRTIFTFMFLIQENAITENVGAQGPKFQFIFLLLPHNLLLVTNAFLTEGFFIKYQLGIIDTFNLQPNPIFLLPFVTKWIVLTKIYKSRPVLAYRTAGTRLASGCPPKRTLNILTKILYHLRRRSSRGTAVPLWPLFLYKKRR